MTKMRNALAATAILLSGAHASLAQTDCEGVSDRGFQPALVVSANVPILAERTSGEEIATADFLQAVKAEEPPLGSSFAAGDRRQVKAADACGFIEHRWLVDSGRPLRVGDLSLDEADPRRDNELFAKVILRNDFGRIVERRADPDLDPEVVTAQSEPSRDSHAVGRLRLFEIFAVFKEFEKGNQHWYFVGASSTSETPVARDMLGWVERADTILWSQREAVYPKRGVDEITIYSDPALQKPMQTLIRDDDEIERGEAINRLPLLRTWSLAGAPLSYGIATAVLGTGGEEALSEESALALNEAQSLRAKLARTIANASQIDVLFVLDNTESMAAYRTAVIEAIRASLADFIGGDAERDLRVAFAFYGDFFKPNSEAETSFFRGDPISLQRIKHLADRPFQFKLIPFGNFGQVPTLEQIGRVALPNGFSDPQKDKPEAAFAGMLTAIESVEWTSNSDFKVVVWIGDDGDRAAPNEMASVESVQAALRKAGAALIPINVRGSSYDSFNSQFIEQANAIAANALEASRSTQDLGSGVNADVGLTRSALEDYLQGLFFTSIQIENITTVEDSNRTRVVETNALRARRAELEKSLALSSWTQDWIRQITGNDPEAIRQIYGTTQTVTEGFVPRKMDDGSEYLDLWIALETNELRLLSNTIEALCFDFNDTASLKGVFTDAAQELVAAVTGDKDPEAFDDSETLDSYFARVLSLPKQAFSLFEGMTLNQYIEQLEYNPDRKEWNAIAQAVCKSSSLLDYVLRDRYVEADWLVYQGIEGRRRLPRFRPRDDIEGEIDDFVWLWRLESGIEFFFVPAAFLPQK